MANLFLTGTGVPGAAIGETTDYYRDVETNLIYYRASTGWEVVPSLIPTPDGVGTTWHFGNGTPSNGVGSSGDYYRDDDNGSVYRKHNVNGWEALGSLDFIGVYGVQWGEGTGAPADIEPLNNLPAGSFYLDVDTSDIYYKDPSLTWSLKGRLGGDSANSANSAATSAENASNSASEAEAYYNSLIASSLKDWAYSNSFALISATRNSNDVITTADIKWPDGTSGVFTTDTINATFNTIDAWHATYLGTVTKTVTQSAVTRNVDGAVTAQPEITIA